MVAKSVITVAALESVVKRVITVAALESVVKRVITVAVCTKISCEKSDHICSLH